MWKEKVSHNSTDHEDQKCLCKRTARFLVCILADGIFKINQMIVEITKPVMAPVDLLNTKPSFTYISLINTTTYFARQGDVFCVRSLSWASTADEKPVETGAKCR